jgi:hypothetical protein
MSAATMAFSLEVRLDARHGDDEPGLHIEDRAGRGYPPAHHLDYPIEAAVFGRRVKLPTEVLIQVPVIGASFPALDRRRFGFELSGVI